jgi:hypothetical protein
MDDDRVERVARAMCKADGKDPDEQMPTGHVTVRAFVQEEATVSAWQKYEPEARRFIAALDAATGGQQ